MNSIAKIQEKLREKELDAILITDEKNQRYAAGFPFTDGYVLVSREKAWLLTDSRYIEAAENSVDSCVTVQMFDRQHSRLSLLTAALKEAKVSRLGAEEQKLNHGTSEEAGGTGDQVILIHHTSSFDNPTDVDYLSWL